MLTLATATGMAAESSDLSVAGTIRPAACRVELSDGGRVEYGTIVAASLNQTEGTRLADRYITLGVHCDGAVKFGVIIPDGRPGTVADGMNDLLGSDNLGEDRTVVRAEVPQTELVRYAVDLRSATHGAGSFTRSFAHYEPMPEEVARTVPPRE